jgi:hypothetical protein
LDKCFFIKFLPFKSPPWVLLIYLKVYLLLTFFGGYFFPNSSSNLPTCLLHTDYLPIDYQPITYLKQATCTYLPLPIDMTLPIWAHLPINNCFLSTSDELNLPPQFFFDANVTIGKCCKNLVVLHLKLFLIH